jgi:hypothetical protein
MRLSQRGKPSRPAIAKEVRALIQTVWQSNPRIVHVNLTEYLTAKRTAQQVVDACPWDTEPQYLLRDRGRIYSEHFRRRVSNMRIEEVLTSLRRPC